MVTGTANQTEQAILNDQANKPGGDGGPGDKGKGAGTDEEKLYSQSELDARLGSAGQKLQRRLDLLSTERDTFKAQATKLEGEIKDARSKVSGLTTEIESLSEKDPDKKALVALRKDYESQLADLKKEKDDLEPARQEVTKFKRDQIVYQVAEDYVTANGEPADKNLFMEKADKFNLSTQEELENLAETMGLTLKDAAAQAGDKRQPVKAFTGTGAGGGETTEEARLKARYPTMDKK